jgi:Xanthine/uracil permeases
VGFQNLGGGDLTAKSFGSFSNLAVGGITIVIILLISAFAKGFIQSIAILIGIVAGSFIASDLWSHLTRSSGTSIMVPSAPIIYFGYQPSIHLPLLP